MADDETVLRGSSPGTPGGAPAAADIDEKVFAESVRRGFITPSQGNAAREEARAGGVPLLDVLLRRGLLTPDAARDLDEEVKEDFVPGYRVISKLGEGGMGVVYRALQKRLDREVALKVVMPRLAGDPAYLKRFEREAKAVAKLNHPNIVAAYDCGESNGRVWLAMEFVDGQSLADCIKREGALPEDRALAVARDVAAGLSHAQAAGIIHRDIKPGNILLAAKRPGDTASQTTSGAKVTDLGLARVGNQPGMTELTAAGSILGTPGYMAPEQAFGEGVDHRADIYALGATLYQMATGSRPFEATTPVAVIARQQTDRLPDPRDLRPECSGGLARLLQGMLSRDAATRYPDWKAVVADIDRVREGALPLHPLPPEEHRSLAPPTDAPAPAGAPATVPLKSASRAPGGGALDPTMIGAAPPPAAPPPPRSNAAVIVAVAVAVAAFAGYALFHHRLGAPDHDPGAAGGEEAHAAPPAPPPAPPADAGGKEEAAPPAAAPVASPGEADAFTEEEERAVGKSLDDGDARAALRRVVGFWRRLQDLPPAKRREMSPRLRTALEKARSAVEARVEEHRRRGEYAEALELARWARGELGNAPAPRLDEQVSALEAVGDRGPAERAALAAARAGKERGDPGAVLAALEGFEGRYDFSPDLAGAADLRGWAEAEMPAIRIESDPTGAAVLVDGKERGRSPLSIRARVGTEVRVEFRLEGYETEVRPVLVLRERPPEALRVTLRTVRPKDPEPAVLLVPAGGPRPLWTGAGLGAWSGTAGEWTISDPEHAALLEGEERKEPASVLRGRSPALGTARYDLGAAVAGAAGWRLDWQMTGEGRRTGITTRVEMQFAVRESGSALVLGIDDQDVYLGTRDGASGELVRTHRLKGVRANFPHDFSVAFHGDVVVASVDGKRVGAVAVPEDLHEAGTLRAAVEGGTGFFSDILVTRLKRP